jgi:DNA-directed RNA polymerase specialized sigma24 family protein
MGSAGSVSLWIERLKAGEAAAAQRLWEGYFARLVQLARARLQAAPRRAADEEDAALSAFDSFCRGAAAGRFPRLHDRDDLWQVLMLLTARKASNLARQERRKRRGGGKVRNVSALRTSASGMGSSVLGLISHEPDPATAAEVAEEYTRLLERLNDPTLRRIAVWKMEGHTNEEIAGRLGRSLATVERKLHLIRNIWEAEDRP